MKQNGITTGTRCSLRRGRRTLSRVGARAVQRHDHFEEWPARFLFGQQPEQPAELLRATAGRHNDTD
jgi:hypothetical protein